MNRQQMMNRPMQPAAEQMATQGRYGDSMLVHMNPVEVQGLASLSPTGELTRNPMTGQPEAFLPFLLPLLGSLGGSAMAGGALATSLGLGSLGATAMGAIGSGLATTAVTGDIKEGIMSGLTGFGIGKAFQGASELMSPEVLGAATDVAGATDAATEAAKLANLGDAGAKTRLDMLTGPSPTVDPFSTGAVNMSPVSNPLIPNMSANPVSGGAVSGSQGSIAYKQNVLDAARFDAGQAGSSAFMQDPAEFAKNFGKTAMTSGSLVPIAAGEGMRGQRMADKANERALQDYEDEKAATLARSTAVRDDAIALARKDYGYQDYGGYQNGGVVSLNPNEYSRQMNGLQTIGMQGGGGVIDFSGMGNYLGRNTDAPAKTQQALRPPNVVTADQLQKEADALTAQGKDPRAGFTGEINYFRETPEEAGIPLPPSDDPDTGTDPDTGGDPIVYPPMMPGKGGNFNPEDFMKNAGSTENGNTTPSPATGGRRGERPNFTMGDMAGLMNGNSSSLYDDSAMAEEVIAGKGSAKSAVDSIGIEAPVVPIYQPNPNKSIPTPEPIVPVDPASLYSDPPMGGRRRQMRFAGGQVLNMQGGGLASVNPQNMAMQDPLSMGDQQPQMMQEAEVMQVVSEVAQVLSQGIPADQFPPELLAKLQELKNLLGEEQMMSMIMAAQAQSAPQGQPPMPPQGQPQMPASNLGAEMGFPQPEPESYNFQEGGATPNPETQLIEQTISAVLGEVPQEQADVIINMFIDEFGQEAFELLREQALQSVVPNAQTEGVIRGQGGGMDDMVDGMIGSEQPVAVSPGEYIVPADVVSGLGDGSTDGGVQELDGMLDRVRQTRTGTTTQPAPMRTGGVLPA